jgi:hypothetical protein
MVNAINQLLSLSVPERDFGMFVQVLCRALIVMCVFAEGPHDNLEFSSCRLVGSGFLVFLLIPRTNLREKVTSRQKKPLRLYEGQW